MSKRTLGFRGYFLWYSVQHEFLFLTLLQTFPSPHLHPRQWRPRRSSVGTGCCCSQEAGRSWLLLRTWVLISEQRRSQAQRQAATTTSSPTGENISIKCGYLWILADTQCTRMVALCLIHTQLSPADIHNTFVLALEPNGNQIKPASHIFLNCNKHALVANSPNLLCGKHQLLIGRALCSTWAIKMKI